MTVSSELSNQLIARSEPADEVITAASSAVPVYEAGAQWDVATKRTVVVILLVVAVGIVWLSQPIIPMMIIASIVAYLINPIVDLFEYLRVPRGVSTILLFVLVMVGLILLPIILVPILINQLRVLSDFDVQGTAASFITWLSLRLNRLPDAIQIFGYIVPLGHSLQELESNLQQMVVVPTLTDILNYIQQIIGTATTVVGSTAYLGISVVGGIVQFFITFVVTFFLSLYLTKDAPQIRTYVQDLFPRSYQSELIELLRHIGQIWQSFFRGQLILCSTVGIITWIALEIAGMPGALILGLVAGALEVIPSLGPSLAMIPAVIVALIQGSNVLNAYGINNFGFALITVAIYFIIQQMENNIIVPRVIGGSVNLHPLVVMCGVVIGFNIAGIWGTFLAAPVIASLRVMGSYIHAKLLDYPPFPDRNLAQNRPRRQFSYRRMVKR